MEKQLSIAIPQPCHEKWEEMTPQDKGRFCNACSKVVVDFTLMTNSEIFGFFNEVSQAKVCGRFNSYQLNRPLEAAVAVQEKNYFFGYLRKIAALLVTSLTLFMSSCNRSTKGKPEINSISVESNSPKKTEPKDTVVKTQKIKQRKRHIVKGDIPADVTAGVPIMTLGKVRLDIKEEQVLTGDTIIINKQ